MITKEEKANELAQEYFPDANNIWARPNLEAKLVKQACLEMASWVEQNLWHPTSKKPDSPHGLIVMTDMGYIFEAIYEDGKFLVSTVRNHKVYFEESIEQECIIKWMKV